MSRCDQLAEVSEPGEGVTRLYLSPEHRLAANRIENWMRAAGMDVRLDEAGNVVGRYHSITGGGPYIVIGSHQDSVVHGGKYDGPLGIVVAIDCVAVLNSQNRRPSFGIEVVAFGDEEGSRFRTTLAGSRAIAGYFSDDLLSASDANGTTLKEAMIAFGLDPQLVSRASHSRSDVLAYIEVHIEQGPVLQNEDLPIGIVSAISGQSRVLFTIASAPNHAGTVPMRLRHDPLLAASEIALATERVAMRHENTVGTVGVLQVDPGLVNVIPGLITMSLDLRAELDEVRSKAYGEIFAALREITHRRGVSFEASTLLDLPSCPCAPWIVKQLETSVRRNGIRPIQLTSGAGHDGMAMSRLTDIGMIFVRCKDGVSHSPKESITAEDAAFAAGTLQDFIENFKPRAPYA